MILAARLVMFRMKFLAAALYGFFAAVVAHADVLAFTDGDRVQGTFVRREGGKIIFQSLRFGNLSVSEADAKVEMATQSTPPPVTTLPMSGGAATEEEELLARFRKTIERGIVRWWEPWQGRIAVSTDVVHDSKQRSVFVVEARAKREWAKDEVRIEPRYEYREDQGVVTTDFARVLGYWRHDFNGRFFTLYRPTFEREKVNGRRFRPFPYMLLQQQTGVGVHILKGQNRELRVGVAENFFNVWALNDETTFSENVESIFLEAEFRLPWRIAIIQRGVRYYSLRTGDQGWENESELTKKLTESLSLGFRYEYRQNNPDVRVTDYERVRLFFGYDF